MPHDVTDPIMQSCAWCVVLVNSHVTISLDTFERSLFDGSMLHLMYFTFFLCCFSFHIISLFFADN